MKSQSRFVATATDALHSRDRQSYAAGAIVVADLGQFERHLACCSSAIAPAVEAPKLTATLAPGHPLAAPGFGRRRAIATSIAGVHFSAQPAQNVRVARHRERST